MAENTNTENITFFLDEEQIDDCLDLNALETQLNEIDMSTMQDDDIFVEMKNYELNFNVKQLMLICEYYNMKDIRVNKLKKQDIIEQIILFETNPENIEIVTKRKELWYYIDELKNDKMMKRFVIWS
ncbi:MAG: hypothetical protein EBY20_06560 [Alphaproteobacteria bacterium]|uniref:Uncharacterized protein n=1 Tax=viral metagenome TaxID=1070528 RepID=A0A6C0HQT0_9ZZZZ|nr:hypothetical protein [Alphaproteobacteria bacterium]